MAQKQIEQKEKLYNQLTKNFSLVIVLIVIFLLAIFYFILIGPKLSASVDKVQDSISFQQNIYNIERQKLARMQENLDYYRQISVDDLAQLEAVIPSPYPKEKLFGEIEDIVLQHGFVLSNLDLSEKIVTDDTEELSDNKLQIISLSFDMANIDYISMKRFLPVLERNLPLMDIVYLDFSPTGETLSLDINTYYFKP